MSRRPGRAAASVGPRGRTAAGGPHGYGCGTMTRKREAPPPYSTSVVRVLRLPGGDEVDDRLAVEEPLELRIGGSPVAVTMRTPGHDEELALGFALSEGLRPLGAHLPDDLAVEHDRARGARIRSRPPGAVVLHDLLLRRLRQGRPRGGRRRVAAGGERAERFRPRSSRPCPSGCSRRRPRSPRPVGCTRRASSPRRASSCAHARTSAATTRWTR